MRCRKQSRHYLRLCKHIVIITVIKILNVFNLIPSYHALRILADGKLGKIYQSQHIICSREHHKWV